MIFKVKKWRSLIYSTVWIKFLLIHSIIVGLKIKISKFVYKNVKKAVKMATFIGAIKLYNEFKNNENIALKKLMNKICAIYLCHFFENFIWFMIKMIKLIVIVKINPIE